MGEPIETLEDLLRPGLDAVCVGINPTPTGVAAGHYYQGGAGRRVLTRLRDAGVIPPVDEEQFDDDSAFAAGVGFTDVVKRPTSNARQLRRAEFDYGRGLLAEKLDAVEPRVVIVTSREAAERLFGKGTVPGVTLAGADVFVMPGPYERSATATRLLDELAAVLHGA
ncbi:MAG: uracil-DNA glycosylase family protein [Solirubrobacteraceae bacterium]